MLLFYPEWMIKFSDGCKVFAAPVTAESTLPTTPWHVTVRRDHQHIRATLLRSTLRNLSQEILPVNIRRTFLFCSLSLVLLVTAAVQPAMAQKTHAMQKRHGAIPAGKTCIDCHKAKFAEWKASPHGKNDVQCSACHGEVTAMTVAATPALSTCETCHADQAGQLKSDDFMKGKTCVTCHPPHGFVPHKKVLKASK